MGNFPSRCVAVVRLWLLMLRTLDNNETIQKDSGNFLSPKQNQNSPASNHIATIRVPGSLANMSSLGHRYNVASRTKSMWSGALT